MGEKYEYLQKVLDDSHYTVALCGSGILAETGDHRKIFSQVPIT